MPVLTEDAQPWKCRNASEQAEVDDWIAARKARFPSAANLERRRAAAAAAAATGVPACLLPQHGCSVSSWCAAATGAGALSPAIAGPSIPTELLFSEAPTRPAPGVERFECMWGQCTYARSWMNETREAG